MLQQPARASLAAVLRLGAAALVLVCARSLLAADVERTGGPYVPTPQAVVDAMLDLAKVGPRDFVIDLGSGDGRIVITAAQRYGARGVGFDIDPDLVHQSNAEAQRRGLADKVSFREQDVLQARVEQATVLTLYLLPGMMQTLQAKLARELKAGTRIVSHDFPFGDWKPDHSVSVDIPEKYGTPGQWKSTLFYWLVPAQVQGLWSVTGSFSGAQPLALEIAQQFQYIEATSVTGGRRSRMVDGKVEGDRVRFKLPVSGSIYEFRGVVDGDTMRGEAVQGTRAVAWSASRSKSAAASD